MSDRLDRKTLDKLRKIDARRTSNFPGERQNADAAIDRVLSPFGYDRSHLEALLANEGKLPPGFDARRSKPPDTHQREKASSQPAIFGWNQRELALRNAVERLCTFRIDSNGLRWVHEIFGLHELQRIDNMPQHIILALRNAFPLPMTILEAVTECEYWIQRDGEITRLLELNPGWNLDLPATIRYKIVRRLITDELRAHTAKDIGLRFRFMVDVKIIRRSECSALERDLKELLELKGKATANSSPRWAEARTGAQVRREAVETMLSDPAGVLLSDREIARRTGVSPQTVGNIRRRLDL